VNAPIFIKIFVSIYEIQYKIFDLILRDIILLVLNKFTKGSLVTKFH